MIVNTTCRAQDPSTCQYHGTPADVVTAEGMYQDYVHKQPTVTGAKKAIGYALESNLQWDGEKPQWWDRYVAYAQSHPLPSTPELLDVIDSPAGKVAVVWEDQSHGTTDTHYPLIDGIKINICYYISYETGEDLGYIKTESRDEATFKKAFGNDEFSPYRWEHRYRGRNYDFYYDTDEEEDAVHGSIATHSSNLKGEALLQRRRELWLQAQQDRRGPISIKTKHKTEEERLVLPDDTQVRNDLKEYSKEIRKHINQEMKYRKNPIIGFARMEEPLKGKGMGTALYVYVARRLAKENKVLKGSSIQSEDAQYAWMRFEKHFPDNVKTLRSTYHGQRVTAKALDFR